MNDSAKKMIAPREATALFLIMVLAQLGMGLVLGFFLIAFAGEDGEISTTANLIISMLAQVACFCIFLWYVYGKKRELRWPLLGARGQGTGDRGQGFGSYAVILALSVGLGLLTLGAFLLPGLWYGIALDQIGFDASDSGLEFTTLADRIIGGIFVVLLAPVVEEFIFRGALLSGLSRSVGNTKAVLLSALAFMLFHMNPSQTVYQFFLGVVCGFAVVYSGKLIAGIVIHAVSNLTVILMDFTPLGALLEEGVVYLAANPWIAALVTVGALVLFGGLIVLILYYFKRVKPSEPEPPPLKELYYRTQISPFIPQDPFTPIAAYPRPDPFAPRPDPFVAQAPPAQWENCSYCGGRNRREAVRCEHCGKPFSASNAPVSAFAPPGAEVDAPLTEAVHAKKMKSARTYFWSACIICAAIWVMTLVLGLGLMAEALEGLEGI